jgi:hypothetical protein
MTTVSISGVYECGHQYTRIVDVPDPGPGQPIEDWWEYVVWEETGDNHTEDEGNCTNAVILACIEPQLIGAKWEWVTG